MNSDLADASDMTVRSLSLWQQCRYVAVVSGSRGPGRSGRSVPVGVAPPGFVPWLEMIDAADQGVQVRMQVGAVHVGKGLEVGELGLPVRAGRGQVGLRA